MVWLHHKKAVHLHHKGVHIRGCTCLRSALPLARARSAPTNQKVHQPTKKCTNKAKNSTNSSVGAAETVAPPKVHQPTKE